MKKAILITPSLLKRTELFVFDLDGTLAESKVSIDHETEKLFCALLAKRKIAVIGGGKRSQFFDQLVRHLSCRSSLLSRLFIFPTNATQFYRYRKGTEWTKIYEHALRKNEIARIR